MTDSHRSEGQLVFNCNYGRAGVTRGRSHSRYLHTLPGGSLPSQWVRSIEYKVVDSRTWTCLTTGFIQTNLGTFVEHTEEEEIKL